MIRNAEQSVKITLGLFPIYIEPSGIFENIQVLNRGEQSVEHTTRCRLSKSIDASQIGLVEVKS